MSLIGRLFFRKGTRSSLQWSWRPLSASHVGESRSRLLGNRKDSSLTDAVIQAKAACNAEGAPAACKDGTSQPGAGAIVCKPTGGYSGLKRKRRLATSQLLNLTCTQLNFTCIQLPGQAGIAIQPCSVLLISFGSSWLPPMLVPCRCKGFVWETAGKATYPAVPKATSTHRSTYIHTGVEDCTGLGKTLLSNFNQIFFLA